MSRYQCPNCEHHNLESQLERVKYAGRNLFQCPNCQGQLVDQVRLQKIKRRVDKEFADLLKENEAANQVDLKHAIRCPRCKNEMEKQTIRYEPEFQIDCCDNCNFVWLDPGELAKQQLQHESTPQNEELRRMRKRVETMSKQEKADYEANLSKLTQEEFVCEVASEAVRWGRWRFFRR